MTDHKWPLMAQAIDWKDKWQLIKFLISSNHYTQGKKVLEFEQEWNEWLGSKNSLFVSNGSNANFLLVSAVMEQYNIKPGDKVLLPACTWMTNVAPPIQLGLTPVFCDINLDTYGFDMEYAQKLKKDHPDIKLIFVSHLLGFYSDVVALKKIFPQAVVIEDVCESHGCTDHNGKKAGAISVGATFSFYFGHHMTTIEGGMVSTSNDQLYDLMKMKRSHGMARHSKNFAQFMADNPKIDPAFLFVTDGYNFRNTELNAVLGLSQLKKLDGFVEIRRKNYANFVGLINEFPHFFEPQKFQTGNSSFCFPIISRNRLVHRALIRDLKKNSIEYRPIVSGNLMKQPFLREYQHVNMPNAQKLHDLGLYIGNNQFVNNKNMQSLREVFASLWKE